MPPFNSRYDDHPEVYDELRSCWLSMRREEFIAKRLLEYRQPEGSLVIEIGAWDRPVAQQTRPPLSPKEVLLN
jgi:hypothetical protein